MRTAKVFALTLVLAAGFLVGCSVGNATARKEAEPIPVKVATAALKDISQTTKLGGRIAAGAEVTVSAKIGGRVQSVPAKAGQRVCSSDLLVALETQDAAAQSEQAEAAVVQAETYSLTAANNLERMQTLRKEGAISQQQFDLVQAEAKAAAARLKQARAAASLARSALENTAVLAPISGLVAGLKVNPGEMVAPGLPLLSIHNIDSVYVEMSVGESDVDRLKIGQEVKVTVAALGDADFPGRIATIDPSAANKSRTFLVKVEVSNPDQRLKPGMFAEVDLVTNQRSRVVTIPSEAVLGRAGKPKVFVLEGGVARERSVKMGLSDGKSVEVTEGLKAGDQVIVAGQNLVSDNLPVSIQP
ncbi:MAG: efflux RND transporter periplasmic adaptor subunit [Actinobacteria bacterium]|nr:efflux RND transporter periplasmic adaptor subunit [Actinomycetota bacterium]